jgi:hypothetical protein
MLSSRVRLPLDFTADEFLDSPYARVNKVSFEPYANDFLLLRDIRVAVEEGKPLPEQVESVEDQVAFLKRIEPIVLAWISRGNQGNSVNFQGREKSSDEESLKIAKKIWADLLRLAESIPEITIANKSQFEKGSIEWVKPLEIGIVDGRGELFIVGWEEGTEEMVVAIADAALAEPQKVYAQMLHGLLGGQDRVSIPSPVTQDTTTPL